MAAPVLPGKLLAQVPLVHHRQILISWAGVGVGRKDPARHRITKLGGAWEITVHYAQAPAQPRSGATWTALVLLADRDQEQAEPGKTALVP